MKRTNIDRLRRLFSRDVCVALCLFGLSFSTYAATLCPTIYSGDDGDLITASATNGVPHPTGYPLFVLLGKLALILLPTGNPAWRMNLMTALFGAAAIAFFYRFAQQLVPERFWAATAALLLAFAPTFWQQSLSCEVYSLTCLFLTLLLYLATLWQRQPHNDRLLLLLALLYGLACTNHLTIVLFLPGFLAFVLAARPRLFREGRLLCLLVVAFLVPLSFYAYLPLAARGNPPVNWGDPSTLQTFWDHITGKQYSRLMFSYPQYIGRELLRYVEYLFREYGLWLLWLVPIGMVSLWKRNRGLCALLLYIWVATIVYAVNYHIFDIYVYYLPSYIVVAAFLAVGASAVNSWAYERLRVSPERRAHYATLVAIVALAVPLLQHALHFGGISKRGNYLEDDLSANFLRSTPPGSLLITSGQWTMTMWYRRFVLHERRDVTTIGRSFLASLTWGNAWYYHHVARMYPDIARTYSPDVRTYSRRYPRKFLELVNNEDFLLDLVERALKRGVPVLVTFQRGEDRVFITQMNARFDAVPWGLCDRLFLKGQAPPSETVVRVNERLWASFQTRGLFDGKANITPMQAIIPSRYAMSLLGLGEHAEHARLWEVAADAYAGSDGLYETPEARAGMERSAKALARSQRSLPQKGRSAP